MIATLAIAVAIWSEDITSSGSRTGTLSKPKAHPQPAIRTDGNAHLRC
ncbi:MAG: hypothetical protein AB7F09_15220 [Parvibaculaceae bacterium]